MLVLFQFPTEEEGSGIVLLLVVLLSWFSMVEVCVLSMVLVYHVYFSK
jgi:hypothetical protein